MSSSKRLVCSRLRRFAAVGAVILTTQSFTLPTLATAVASTEPVRASNESNLDERDAYILGPGDRLQAEFFSVPEFSKEYQVLPNGTLNLPRIGGINVEGMTLSRASAVIAYRYRNYLTRPLVTLSLIEGRSVNVAIAGEINRPGAYNLSSSLNNSAGSAPTLTRLIQISDGVTQAADLENIQVRRRAASGMQAYRVNLWQLMRSGNSRQDLRLKDGDSIYIPATQNIDLAQARERTRLNIATSSNRPLRIAIVGEVNRPGPYTIFEGSQNADGRTATPNSVAPSITKALQISGGITQLADLRNIQIERMTHTGQTQAITVDFWQLLKSGDVLQDLPLQDGDKITVARAPEVNDKDLTEIADASFSPDRIAINIVGEVERPGTVNVAPNTPLNQGILAAGGFNKRAKRQSVTLVRLEPNGTVSKREIDIDFSQGLNTANNPALRRGDTVIIKRNGISSIGDSLGILSTPITGAFGLLRLLGIVR